jgi:hypothetical protein
VYGLQLHASRGAATERPSVIAHARIDKLVGKQMQESGHTRFDRRYRHFQDALTPCLLLYAAKYLIFCSRTHCELQIALPELQEKEIYVAKPLWISLETFSHLFSQ